MRPVALAGILASTTMLGGCAGTIAGASFSSISSFAGFASTIFTGADLGEHAASIVTGKDCRFSEGLLREDRDICEEPGSLATRDDFHGIFIDRIEADGTVIFAAPKYMPAGVGAGEHETTTARIWAEIKSGKAKEESERQLARANAAQTIDVAALATGSLMSESLAFIPAATAAELADGETASQTAASARPVVNAAKPAPKKAAQETKAAVDLPLDQPAIEEVALTAPLKAAKENGQGGPLIVTTGSSAPVVSTLVNGEPVVILKLQPAFGGVAPAADTASAEPSDVSYDDGATVVALPAKPASAPSPQAILSQPVNVAAVEPQLTSSRPRTKPSAAELAAVETTFVEDMAEKPKPVRRKRAELKPADDVYQPPARETEAVSSTTPDMIAASPVHTPGDIPMTPMSTPSDSAPAPVATYVPQAAPSEPAPAATAGPAPLYPIAQP